MFSSLFCCKHKKWSELFVEKSEKIYWKINTEPSVAPYILFCSAMTIVASDRNSIFCRNYRRPMLSNAFLTIIFFIPTALVRTNNKSDLEKIQSIAVWWSKKLKEIVLNTKSKLISIRSHKINKNGHLRGISLV